MDAGTIIAVAEGAGADTVGITSADPFDEARQALISRTRRGLAGPLHFTYDDPVTATDVRRTHPWARSLVVVGCDYTERAEPPHQQGALVARFATDDHYRPVRRALEAVAAAIEGAGGRAGILVDDNALADRAAASRAGLGWVGRSTMVLAPGHGPWLLFGSVATDLELPESAPMRRTCGTCVECIPACPTGAITEDGLDARLCLSTWLQTAGTMPMWVRPLVERRIYGCDDCLTSCPPGNPRLAATPATSSEMSFADLLALGDDELQARFSWFYVPHRDPRFLRRNLLVAAGNSAEESAVPAITAHLDHRSSLVRGHAYWSLGRSIGAAAWVPLRERYAVETAPDARVELEQALLMLRADG